MRDATTATFDELVLAAPGPVLVDFWAEWCPPCRAVEPILARLGDELAGRLSIVRVNADEEPELALRYRALSLPLLLVFRAGEVVATIVGARPKPALEAALAPHLAPAPTGASGAGSAGA